jgi:hypothetical protein
MNKGNYYFEIELEPRYAGNYHLNPAKAELMYFPCFLWKERDEKSRDPKSKFLIKSCCR